jgi:hypothetical protein
VHDGPFRSIQVDRLTVRRFERKRPAVGQILRRSTDDPQPWV